MQLRSPEGLYLGEKIGITVDRGRVLRVGQRIIEGLIAHHSGEPLTPDLSVRARLTRDVGDLILSDEHPWPTLRESLNETPLQGFAEGAFLYRCVQVPDQIEASVWIFFLYKTVGFLGISIPEGEAEKRMAERLKLTTENPID